MVTPTDRRVRRTRDLLHRSLIALILEKGYARITVKDILDRADVGRSTFYTHYRDKDALLLDGGLDHLRAILIDIPDEPNTTAGSAPVLPAALAVFRLVDSNRRLYRAMIGNRGSDLIVVSARTMLGDVLAEQLRARLPRHDARQLDVAVVFLVSALMGLITWWLDEQVPLSAPEMYARFENLATGGIAALLSQPHPDPAAAQRSRPG
jgi:AcrR family transcriptional regulator